MGKTVGNALPFDPDDAPLLMMRMPWHHRGDSCSFLVLRGRVAALFLSGRQGVARAL